MAFAQKKPFDRGFFAVDERNDNFSILGILTGFADRQVAIQNTGILHGISFDVEGKDILTPKNIGIDDNASIPFFLGIHGKSGCNITFQKNYFPGLILTDKHFLRHYL